MHPSECSPLIGNIKTGHRLSFRHSILYNYVCCVGCKDASAERSAFSGLVAPLLGTPGARSPDQLRSALPEAASNIITIVPINNVLLAIKRSRSCRLMKCPVSGGNGAFSFLRISQQPQSEFLMCFDEEERYFKRLSPHGPKK